MGIETPFLGLLISLAFIAVTGFYPGGIIVPSYLVLFIGEPFRIMGTLAAALAAYALYRWPGSWLILFGRRRLVFLILAGGCCGVVLLHLLPACFPVSAEFRVIGWVIPGLIAHHMDRQGTGVTIAGMVTVTVLTGWLAKLAGLV